MFVNSRWNTYVTIKRRNSKMTIKGLLFDLDGVIVSTEQNHYVAWKRTADELGINFGHKENEQLKGLSRVDSLKAILALANKTIEQDYFDALLQTKNEFYLQSIQTLSKADLLPGFTLPVTAVCNLEPGLALL
jgi:beta-phosphoglucomutase